MRAFTPDGEPFSFALINRTNREFRSIRERREVEAG